MTEEQFEKAFKKLDIQFAFHLAIHRKELLLKTCKTEEEKRMFEKTISNLELTKRIVNL